MTITWLHNGRVVQSNTTQVEQTTNTVQLTRRPQDGVYQCVFNDAVGYILRRSITLLGMYMYVHNAPYNILWQNVMMHSKLVTHHYEFMKLLKQLINGNL